MLDKTIDGKYTLIGLEEKGEAFQSHLAHYHLLGTQVMVDLIYPGRLPGGAAPLTSRLDTLVTLRHPAIRRVFAWGEEEDYIFVVREFTHGTLLPELLQESGDLPPGQSLELLRVLVGGLGALHGRGIYFLGLNPHQVWMDRNGQAGLLRPGYSFLLEREDERLSREAAPYWAPEVLAGGEGTRASDVFSLGVMARRLLSSSRDDQELWRALREASTHDPARRPSSARIFLERVEVLMSSPAAVKIPVNQPVNQPPQPAQPVKQPVVDSAPSLLDEVSGEDPDCLSSRERLERLVRSQPVSGIEPPSGRGDGRKRRLRLVSAGAAAVLAAILLCIFAGTASHAPRQAPQAGSSVEVGEESPEQQLVMPDLRGMDSIQARRLLQEMGLEVEVISEPSNVIPEGKVIIQEPLKGEYMRRGSKVKVYVSKGPLQQQTTDSGRNTAIPTGDLVPGRGNARREPRGSNDPEELMTANPETRDHAS